MSELMQIEQVQEPETERTTESVVSELGRTAFEVLAAEADNELSLSSPEDETESIRVKLTRLPDGQTVPDN